VRLDFARAACPPSCPAAALCASGLCSQVGRAGAGYMQRLGQCSTALLQRDSSAVHDCGHADEAVELACASQASARGQVGSQQRVPCTRTTPHSASQHLASAVPRTRTDILTFNCNPQPSVLPPWRCCAGAHHRSTCTRSARPRRPGGAHSRRPRRAAGRTPR